MPMDSRLHFMFRGHASYLHTPELKELCFKNSIGFIGHLGIFDILSFEVHRPGVFI
jgi:hypothetical protein